MSKPEFMRRTGGIGSHFGDLSGSWQDAPTPRRKKSGVVKTSDTRAVRLRRPEVPYARRIASTYTPSTRRPLDGVALVQYSRVDVPTGKTPNLFSEEDYDDDDGAEPFGASTGVQSGFWVCNDLGRLRDRPLVGEDDARGVALGAAWILVAWKHELSLEMKPPGPHGHLGRCLTVAAETTRVHVMMARFRVQDLRSGAVVARRPPRHRRDAFTPTVWSRRRSGKLEADLWLRKGAARLAAEAKARVARARRSAS